MLRTFDQDRIGTPTDTILSRLTPTRNEIETVHKQIVNSVMVQFAQLSRPVAFIGCRHLIDDFPRYFRNWRFTEISGHSAVKPAITVARTSDGYRLTAPWFDGPLERYDDIDAVCALIAEVIRGSVDEDSDLLCLHAAAAVIAGRLVVFPNRYRAGKSLLSGCLAAHGARVFADDVLPLVGSEAMAPGVSPRLRLPLPDNLDPTTSDFLMRHHGPSNGHYGYLDLPATHLAGYGERAAIESFVLLDRRDEGDATLEPIERSRVLRQTIWQNFGREAGAEQILSRLERAVAQASCYRLTYARADDAARLLKETFSKPPSAPAGEAAHALDRTPDCTTTELTVAATGTACYRRCASLSETEMDGERYLADSRTGAIHHLDTIATAVWRLLANPMCEDNIVEDLSHAFPDVRRSQIAADVRSLLNDLEKKKLISLASTD